MLYFLEERKLKILFALVLLATPGMILVPACGLGGAFKRTVVTSPILKA